MYREEASEAASARSIEAFGSTARASAERDLVGRTATMTRSAVKRTSVVVTVVGAVTLALVDGARCAEAAANDDANGANTLDARRLERADSSAVVEVMEEAIARGGAIASLGFGLSDVQPDVVDSALPHGVGGWRWQFAGKEGATFQCLDYAPSGLGQEVLSPGDDEYADAEEHSATTDLEMKRYIVRYGTHGTFADTGTHKYDDAWFEDPAHAGDIKWTYGTCRTNQTIFCGSSAFAYVDPFPSIGSGQKGKKCQYIDVSQIPDNHRNESVDFVPGTERLDQNSINVAVNLELPRANGGGTVQRTIKLFSFSKLAGMLKRMFPDTVAHQDFNWDWCADEGVGEHHRCKCNTIMRYGWTGNQTLAAPIPRADPDYHKWTFVDVRGPEEDEAEIPCNWHKLGGVRPFPERGEENRICQCLSNATMADFNAGLQAIIGGPDVPGQVLFNMTNHTHYFNRTHYDHWRNRTNGTGVYDGSETLEPSLGVSEDDVSSSHDDDHEFLAQSNVDMNDRGVDVLLTNLGVGCVAVSASIFVFVAARRLVASRRTGGAYERVPEPELDL